MDTFDNIIVYLYRCLILPLYILGNLGNLCNALIFFRRSWRKNVCVFYFIVCVLVDLININVTILEYMLDIGFHISLETSNVIFCKVHKYFSFIVSTLTPTILVLASIDRLLISSENINTRLYSSKRLAYFSISLSSCFWLIFYFHILIKFDLQQTSPSIFICFFDSQGFYRDFLYYSLLITYILLFVTMISLSILSLKKVHQIRLISRQQGHQVRSMHKKDFQLLRCLFAHNIIYILCNIFLATLTTYKAIINYQPLTPSEEALDNFLMNVGVCLRHISYCTSFFIYIGISKAFRREFLNLYYKFHNKNQQVMPGEENNEQEARQDNVELRVINAIVIRNYN